MIDESARAFIALAYTGMTDRQLAAELTRVTAGAVTWVMVRNARMAMGLLKRRGRGVMPAVTSRTRRRLPPLAIFGETRTLLEWSRDPRCRVSYPTLYRRFTAGIRGEALLAPAPRGRPRKLVM